MRRSSRIYLDATVNSGKLARLKSFLNEYKLAEQYAIVRFWSAQDFSSALAGADVTKSIEERYGFSPPGCHSALRSRPRSASVHRKR